MTAPDLTSPDTTLARLLSEPEQRPLSEPERALIRAALTELARANSVVALQQRLLESFEREAGTIEAEARAALDAISPFASTPSHASAHDFPGARAAREELLRRLRESDDLRHAFSLVLRFVRTAAALA